MEVRADPLVVEVEHGLERPFHQDLLLAEHGDAVAGLEQAVEVVRHHVDGQTQRVAQGHDELVEIGGADRVEAGGRLVEEDDVGVERQGSGQRRALDHAARKLGRILLRRVGRETDEVDLEAGQFVHQLGRDVEILAHRNLDVLEHRERGEERALLEEHAPTLLDAEARGFVGPLVVDAEDLDRAALLGVEAEDGAQEHGLAGAGRADEAQDLAPAHVERQAVENGLRAEPDRHIPGADDDVVILGGGCAVSIRWRHRKSRKRHPEG